MAEDRGALQRRTLRVLVAGQVLGGAAIGVGSAVSPLLARDILGADRYAGLAFAAFAFGAASAAIPLSRIMARHGRRRGLTRGYGVAMVGAGAAVAAAASEQFLVLLVGMFLFGCGGATNLLARYAGADLAEPEHRARAISTVVWATTAGAVAGPNVLGPAGRVAEVFDLPRLAGPYLVAVVCFALAATALNVWLRPDPMAVAGLLDDPSVVVRRDSILRQLQVLVRIPAALLALATMAVAHGVMVSVMTMTPLHLRDHGDSLQLVGVVISLHIAGMYALAPLVGSFTDRVGAVPVARTAAATLVLAAVLAAGAGHAHLAIGTALVLLGLGWSMATISGATLLTAAIPPAERARVQGVADMTMGLAGGTGGVLAGVVVGAFGFGALSAAGAAVAVALLLAVVVWGRSAVDASDGRDDLLTDGPGTPAGVAADL